MSAMEAGTVADAAIRLGLVNAHQADEAWHELGSRKVPAEDFLRALERKAHLTPYQSDKLLKGETTGYFVGGYRILYKIASGSFGRVYRADDPSSGRIVAIKVLRSRWSKDKHKIDLFTREGKMGMTLRHPNIVEILAVNHDKANNQFYIVMEFVEGGNLRDFLKIRKTLPPNEVLRILDDMSAGLAHAFSKGLTHRDMKLTNVLLSSAGPAKLVDFGLAGGQVSQSGQVGTNDDKDELTVDRTVDYAGLERTTNAPHGDPRSDIFFVGCCAYELLTGRSPLEYFKSAQTRMSAQRFMKIQPIKPTELSAPPSVFRLIENMMVLDPNQRIQTPAQLLDQVRECRAEVEGIGRPDAKKNQATIFLVESDEKLQDLLRAKLKEQGFRILIASDPVRALDRFRTQPFDLLIVDVATTGENGYYVFERIMEDAKNQNLNCGGILLLAEENTDWQERMSEYENVQVLIQPVKYRQLSQAIRAHFKGD
ncbi:MAG TPA: serine/threonine-protein kinase [Gemmataceae bacterium]|nr:serine/threonine-protein kinase [Gemmataceae bacterium]